MGLIPRRQDPVLEKDIESKSRTWAMGEGWLVYKFTSPSQRSVPDRIFIKGGRVVFIEYKRPGGRVTPGQQREHDKLREHGAEIHVSYSIDDTKAILGARGSYGLSAGGSPARSGAPDGEPMAGHGPGQDGHLPDRFR